jgi:coenzyme F420-reducing hydrogenase delta subunit
MVFRNLLDFIGFDKDRIVFSWVSAAEGAKWGSLVNEVVEGIRKIGPYKEYVKLSKILSAMPEEVCHD